MSTDATTPDTIVLIHCFWVTPRSWEHWITRYESRGYRVLAPAYPRFEVEVEALNADPSPVEAVTVPQIIEHLEAVIGELDSLPILIGHSAGGVFTQVLLDHGFGAAGVAINSAPTESVKVCRCRRSSRRSRCSRTPRTATRRSASRSHWQYAFTHTFSEEESRRLYERYHIPASGQILWGSALANIHPGRDDNYVNYKDPDRAPLLFILGGENHLMPPAIQRSNAKHYKAAGTVTEVKEFEGRAHLMPAQEGWEEVADHALTWAAEHAVSWAAERGVPSSA